VTTVPGNNSATVARFRRHQDVSGNHEPTARLPVAVSAAITTVSATTNRRFADEIRKLQIVSGESYADWLSLDHASMYH
jgi:hypothetical protein